MVKYCKLMAKWKQSILVGSNNIQVIHVLSRSRLFAGLTLVSTEVDGCCFHRPESLRFNPLRFQGMGGVLRDAL